MTSHYFNLIITMLAAEPRFWREEAACWREVLTFVSVHLASALPRHVVLFSA